ncbi:MAG: lipoyl synthase [Desulfobacteraceae bacterium]|nr:lipoyl synthase [Desulfobacteraceae bacterium]
MNPEKMIKTGKPAWLKKSLPKGGDYQRVRNLLSKAGLHTVCKEAGCPNMFECFSKDTATFMILGSECTRNCRFCNITNNTPSPVDPGEPLRVAKAALDLKLNYIVVTSVTRDDLNDGGASHFAATLRAIRSLAAHARIEVLIPDFKGDREALKTVLAAKPDVLNHNIETVAALYPRVRPEAIYERSLSLLQAAKSMDPALPVKSGIMVGLGETPEELEETLKDLFAHGCDIITLGQYLQPTPNHLRVERYYSPEEFIALEKLARSMGFQKIAAGPFVRSSYQAHELSGL